MRAGFFLSLLTTLLLTTPVEGQVRIFGRVIDDVTERPLTASQVTARARDGRFLGRVETDSLGTFEFDVKHVSSVRLDVRRVGYKANTTPLLHFDERNYFQVEVRLDPEAILLAPLEVVAWAQVEPSPFLENFRHRLKIGNGIFITREQIEARRPELVADLLRDIPGIVVTGSGTGNRASVNVGRAQAVAQVTGCEAQIYVDGFLVNRRTGPRQSRIADFRIDDVVSPMSVEGIEIYRGLSTVPAEFLNPDARCGVIVIWTRRGSRR